MSRGRRHSTGFGYIGFGNNQSTFNQSSRKPFSNYKEKLDLEAHLHYKVNFLHKDLSQEDKQRIKDKIRKQEFQLRKKTLLISSIVFIGLGYLIYYLINQIMSR